MSATSGSLKLHVIEAKLTRDTETFSKMDPYCKIQVRDQMFQTKVLDGAGKMPKWNEVFTIDVKYIGDDMEVVCLDKDVTKSDTIGSANIKLSSLAVNGGLDDWFDIQYKGKKAGALHLKGVWTPHGAVPAQKAAQAAPQVVIMQQPGQPMMQ